MGLAVRERPADLLDEDGALLMADAVLPLLAGEVRIEGLQLVGGDEEDLVRQMVDGVRPLVPDLMLHVLDDLENLSHDLVENHRSPVFAADDHLPVPLVHVGGVEIVEILVAADRVHVGVEAFARLKAVFSEREALPFRERLDNLEGGARKRLHVELNRALDAV